MQGRGWKTSSHPPHQPGEVVRLVATTCPASPPVLRFCGVTESRREESRLRDRRKSLTRSRPFRSGEAANGALLIATTLGEREPELRGRPLRRVLPEGWSNADRRLVQQDPNQPQADHQQAGAEFKQDADAKADDQGARRGPCCAPIRGAQSLGNEDSNGGAER
jgi:hypothetical protein